MKQRTLEIMDTTLRDGEQTSGMSFSASEKLTLAKLLLTELNVDRIEIASARVSKGEYQAVLDITNWAKENDLIDQIEILTFVDNGISLKWLLKTGATVQNLLTKGSLNHLKYQLKQTPKEHFKLVENEIRLASKNKIITNVYLEDWSNGMRNFEVDHYICWGTPDDLHTYRYWQEFFNKVNWHPYDYETDYFTN